MGGFYRLKQALDEIAQMSFDPSRPDPGQREKTNLIFIFTFCVASKVLSKP